MIFCFCLFIFLINQSFSVQKLLVDISQMFFQNLFTFKVTLELFVDFFNDSSFLLDQLIKLFVLVIGKLRNIVFILWVVLNISILILIFIILIVIVIFIKVLLVVVVVVFWRILHFKGIFFETFRIRVKFKNNKKEINVQSNMK